MEGKTCYVYMIECKNNALYTGITNDAVKRWYRHFKGFAANYTKIHGCKRPVFLKKFASKGLAMKEENRIKKLSRTEKLLMVVNEDAKLLFKFKKEFNKKFYK